MDILNEMTKDEIIMWVRSQASYIFHPPKKSDVLWMRYQKKEKEVSDNRKEHIERGKSLNMVERDKLAKQFNTTNDANKRLEILTKMVPYEKKWQSYLDEGKDIMRAEKKVDKLYAQIEIERTKENETAA